MITIIAKQDQPDLEYLSGANHYDDKGHKTGHSNPGILGGWNHYDD